MSRCATFSFHIISLLLLCRKPIAFLSEECISVVNCKKQHFLWQYVFRSTFKWVSKVFFYTTCLAKISCWTINSNGKIIFLLAIKIKTSLIIDVFWKICASFSAPFHPLFDLQLFCLRGITCLEQAVIFLLPELITWSLVSQSRNSIRQLKVLWCTSLAFHSHFSVVHYSEERFIYCQVKTLKTLLKIP